MNKGIRETTSICWISEEDWFNLGKIDAWAKRPKQPPEEDSQAARIYELGYSEGQIESRPIETIILPNLLCQIK